MLLCLSTVDYFSMNQIDLNNRLAVVTGASQGFGYAIAKRLVQSGAKVINLSLIHI